jgi:hypothetical protein
MGQPVRSSAGVLLLLAAVATLLSFTGNALGAQPEIWVHPLDLHAYSRLYSDGRRWAAYELTPAHVRVIDALTGRRFLRAVPRGCLLASVGGGVMLFDCPAFDRASSPGFLQQYAIENITTGHVQHITLPLMEGVSSGLQSIGSQWAQGFSSDETPSGLPWRLYFNWHTHTTIEGALGEGETSALRDVELTSLDGTLCAPLHRLPSSSAYYIEEEERFAWVAYAPPFAVTGRDSPPEGRTVTLERCGSRRNEILEERRQPLSERELQIGGGVVSWPCGREARHERNSAACATRLYPFRRQWRGRIYRLAVPRTVTPGNIQHTASTVYWSGRPGLGDSEESSAEGNEQIYGVRLP